jgi:PAS domain S-box-containing protein
MDFVAEKDHDLIPFVLSQILDAAVTGITVSDPDLEDNPIVYANEVFERITGYRQEEILGRNCRFLQGQDRDQEQIARLRAAVAAQQPLTVTLRNYRKDGTLFYNRLSVRPLYDQGGQLIYYLGVQHDVTKEIQAEKELERLNALLGQ